MTQSSSSDWRSYEADLRLTEIQQVRMEIQQMRSELLRWMFGFWVTTLLALAGMVMSLK